MGDSPDRPVLRLAVLASGTGSNFDAIADAIDAGEIHACIEILVCNRAGAAVIDKADQRNIKSIVLEHNHYASREAFERDVVAELKSVAAELVILAGFDRVLTSTVLSEYPGRVLNVHPALLPAFKGLDAQTQAFEYGVKIAGATVHIVDEQLDHGPIIVQGAVTVAANDSAESLRQRILKVEHRIYPEAVRLFAEGRVKVEGRKVTIDGSTCDTTATLVNPSPPC